MARIDPNELSERLAGWLRTRIEEPQVHAEWNDSHKLFVSMVSPSFEEMDEADRQELAWESVYKTLTEDENYTIEFIFTEAPSEIEA
jgi:hypothetical protein